LFSKCSSKHLAYSRSLSSLHIHCIQKQSGIEAASVADVETVESAPQHELPPGESGPCCNTDLLNGAKMRQCCSSRSAGSTEQGNRLQSEPKKRTRYCSYSHPGMCTRKSSSVNAANSNLLRSSVSRLAVSGSVIATRLPQHCPPHSSQGAQQACCP